jgi:lipopolysaccharide export system permease protein
MSLLSRYVIRTVIGYTGLVMIILLILCGLYLFITQQDDIGVGNYQTADALMFMLLNLPEYGFELLPIGALIGSLIGLGNLARSSELIVMRTSGTSVFRMAAWVGSAGVFLALMTWVIGDYVAPQLREQANQQKTQAKFNQFVRAGDQSVWARDNNTFISVRQQPVCIRVQ